MGADRQAIPWGVHRLRNLIGSRSDGSYIGCGVWVRAVPEPYYGNRLTAAWWVLTGQAHAIVWPKSGELEAALDEDSDHDRR